MAMAAALATAMVGPQTTINLSNRNRSGCSWATASQRLHNGNGSSLRDDANDDADAGEDDAVVFFVIVVVNNDNNGDNAKNASGGGVGATTNRRMRDEGSKEEGKDGKGDGNATATAVMDGATVMAMDGNGGYGRRDGKAMATEGVMATQERQQRQQWKVQ